MDISFGSELDVNRIESKIECASFQIEDATQPPGQCPLEYILVGYYYHLASF